MWEDSEKKKDKKRWSGLWLQVRVGTKEIRPCVSKNSWFLVNFSYQDWSDFYLFIYFFEKINTVTIATRRNSQRKNEIEDVNEKKEEDNKNRMRKISEEVERMMLKLKEKELKEKEE